MNILFISSKKRFDLITGRYLQHYGNVTFVTATPWDSAFFRTNSEHPIEIFRNSLKVKQTNNADHGRYQKYLRTVGLYNKAESSTEKKQIAKLFLSTSRLFQRIFKQKDTDICLVHERDFIDTAAAQHAAEQSGVKIYYFSSGFFRGETLSVAPERILFTDIETWQQRVNNFTKDIDDESYSCNLPFHEAEKFPVLKTHAWKIILSKIHLLVDPASRRLIQLFRPRKSLFTATLGRFNKKRVRKIKPDTILMPENFILLPLQGNEIVNEVPNPLGIKNMEHLALLAINSVAEMNKKYGCDYKLIIKEHPLRPFVISNSFAAKNPDTIFLRKFDMNRLLDSAALILTFNSLAGFEALQKNRPVVMLGPLFYGIPGLVHRPSSLSELADIIYQALDSCPDSYIQDKLIAYLKTVYEVEADRKNLDSSGLYNIACKICV